MPEAVETRLIVIVLALAFGIGIFLQFLEDYKMDDEPVKTQYIPIYTITSSVYAGTASTTTTTL